jgi:DNA invertase Pin-like site-specific DNA recombinase
VFAEFECEILRERVKAGIAQAREEGCSHGRPPTARRKAAWLKHLYAGGEQSGNRAAAKNRSDVGPTHLGLK